MQHLIYLLFVAAIEAASQAVTASALHQAARNLTAHCVLHPTSSESYLKLAGLLQVAGAGPASRAVMAAGLSLMTAGTHFQETTYKRFASAELGSSADGYLLMGSALVQQNRETEAADIFQVFL